MKSIVTPVGLLVYLLTLSTFCAAQGEDGLDEDILDDGSGSALAPGTFEPGPAPGPAPGELEPEIFNATFVEGLQAGNPSMAPQLGTPEDCSKLCLETEECIAWSHNSNDGQCRVFKCINELQPNNPDYVTGIFDDVSCSEG